jgi:hypothetical protein
MDVGVNLASRELRVGFQPRWKSCPAGTFAIDAPRSRKRIPELRSTQVPCE